MQVSEGSVNNTASIKNLQGFDGSHPPDPKLIDSCVHCGFCLSTCPSYRVLGKEMDSPRGRIYLMDAINEGEIALNTATVEHFDSCLGCLACVSTCPSGVQYDKLISATRHQVERNYNRSLPDKLVRQLIFSLFPNPDLLRILLFPLLVYQKLGISQVLQATGLIKAISPRLAAMESILPEITLKSFQDNLPDIIPAKGEKRYRVGVILGCVQRLFFSGVNEATVRVLTANGCEVVIPKSQGCCAALPEHQGQTEQAKVLARQMIDSFADTYVDFVIINAAGCGHTLKEYGHILADDPEYAEKAKVFAAKVKDSQEFLANVGLTAKLSPLTDKNLTLVYQDACHLLHGQKISVQPRQLLKQIPGVTLKEPIDAALCCGSAGVYNMLQPEVAEELGKQKAQNLINTGADLIASPNPGCSLQISKYLQGKTISVMHPMELLDYSIRGDKLDM
ncbi:heterodisulfide reductase-related iron-sulfur binding cluster [Dolichospermum sp. UHCC 0684]|uniref:(Fe-S)-binding protein n=1 Tax=unclassified Dolichospermum TaxID=2622029 RepID=UPI001446D979|nr:MULTISPECIES: heterodisulfide reductase-related iron-sulfur binding cluster [unclassified Dolichospermum]MEA5531231.1 heterodisulfide reductase-related iron-sulfur binding cluster [Dolichospermum sp. UHCC 0684]MTJ35197.1 4Fe-4S dicluster domain-containing protein [Dolichospermum sp. UHCC 0260]